MPSASDVASADTGPYVNKLNMQHFFDWRMMSFQTFPGWMIVVANLVNGLVGAGYLVFIVRGWSRITCCVVLNTCTRNSCVQLGVNHLCCHCVCPCSHVVSATTHTHSMLVVLCHCNHTPQPHFRWSARKSAWTLPAPPTSSISLWCLCTAASPPILNGAGRWQAPLHQHSSQVGGQRDGAGSDGHARRVAVPAVRAAGDSHR